MSKRWVDKLKSNLSIKKIIKNVVMPAVDGVGGGGSVVEQPSSGGILPRGQEKLYLFGGLAVLVVLFIVLRKR